jgi:hypothetical protein
VRILESERQTVNVGGAARRFSYADKSGGRRRMNEKKRRIQAYKDVFLKAFTIRHWPRIQAIINMSEAEAEIEYAKLFPEQEKARGKQ